MSEDRKRLRGGLSTPGGSKREQAPPSKKRAIAAKMVGKWKKENDKELDTATWLCYKMEDRDHVLSLNCCVCTQFRQKLECMRNYNKAYVVGSKNLRASSFKDLASSEMHSHAMLLLKKQ